MRATVLVAPISLHVSDLQRLLRTERTEAREGERERAFYEIVEMREEEEEEEKERMGRGFVEDLHFMADGPAPAVATAAAPLACATAS